MDEQNQSPAGPLTGGFVMDDVQHQSDDIDRLRAIAVKSEPKVEAVCPHCLRDAASSVNMPSDDDKRAWLRSILGGTSFVKQYSIFGGQGQLSFRSLTVSDRDDIAKQLQSELQSGELPGGNSDAAARLVQARALNLRMAVSILIDGSAARAAYTPREAYIRNIASRSEDFYAVARQLFIEFESLCINLRLGASSPNFWKGIESRS